MSSQRPLAGLPTDLRILAERALGAGGDSGPATRSRRRLQITWVIGAFAVAVTLAILMVPRMISSETARPESSSLVINAEREPRAVLMSVQRVALIPAEERFAETFTRSTEYWPPIQFFFGEEATFVAVGTVQANLDLTPVGRQAITVSDDRASVVVMLPEPQLAKPNLDLNKSQIISAKSGVAVPFIELFAGEDPNKRKEIYELGAQRIADAAQSSNLLREAKESARGTLTQILVAAGFKDVRVQFPSDLGRSGIDP